MAEIINDNENSIEIVKKEKPNTIEHAEMQQVQKLLKHNPMIVYHGNKERDMVPTYGKGEEHNDYGQGFYTTPDKELGKEWAMSAYSYGNIGYLHTYEIDTTGLNILDLTKLDSLHWIAELLTHRTLNIEDKEVLQDTIELFLKKYKLDTSKYDIIIGYRADDSYFTYAEDFISGFIYKETVERALRHGNLGIQIFIKSEEAFRRLKSIKEPEIVPDAYRQKGNKRKENAKAEYKRDRMERQNVKKKERVFDFI